jgi:hypothetical protein
MPLEDKMNTQDHPPQVAVRCAKCNELVTPNTVHNCQQKGESNESSDQK